MSVIQASGAGETSSGFYSHSINQSLRFEDGDSAYLYKTYGSSAGGNTSTWTFSVWLKISDPNAQKVIWAGSAAGGGYTTNLFYIQLRGDSQSNRLDITWRQNSSTTRAMSTNRAFRDTGSWMHMVLACDTTQGTASNRLRLYINGTEETSFSTDNRSTISQSSALPINANSYDHAIGRVSYSASAYFDGYMAEINFVDGSQLAPTSFGETKAGIWIPKNYTGSHGTTGFYLPFDDSSALGDDESANTNDWTPSGLAATDVVLDSPTNNWATLNPLANNQSATMSEGNLKVVTPNTGYGMRFSTIQIPTSGKWYFEGYLISQSSVGAILGVSAYDADGTWFFAEGSRIGLGYYFGGALYGNQDTSGSSYGDSYAAGDIISVAVNVDDDEVTFYKNNSSQGADSFDAAGLFATFGDYSNSNSCAWSVNFGQDSSFAGNKTSGSAGASDANGKGDFYYSPPSGFLALCTANLSDPGIDPAQDEEPADYFNTVLYSGNSGTQNVTGVGFQPDWVWIKPRNTAVNHVVHTSTFDNPYNYLIVNRGDIGQNTNANFDWFKSFDSDGFTVAYSSSNGTTSNNWNGNYNYVSWNWLAGGSASSNSNGSITSSVSANTEAGFSIVTYTGNATAGATVGHGLSSTPEMYIVKSRSLSTGWVTYHKDAAASPEDGYLILNGTDAFYDTVVWNDTAPTSSVFSLGGSGYSSNNSGATYVAYCFHSVDGYSKVGSYLGNGSSDGVFIYTGFRPAWIMIKRIDSTGGWSILDDVRASNNNPVDRRVQANDTDTEESAGVNIDFNSNGFKLRNSASSMNNSSGSYIYLAFAEQPFKYSNAR